MRDHLVLYVNGQRCCPSGADAFSTLSDFLRRRLRLTGTKVVCAEGDCGACSVLAGRPVEGRLRYRTIDSCIAFVHQLDACHVVTVEGLQPAAGGLSPVQQAMVDGFGSQCGFCTPGFVVTLTGLLEEREDRAAPLDEPRLRRGLIGNLCRCTGYVQILEAGRAVDPAAVVPLAELYGGRPDPAELESLGREPVHIEDRCEQGDRLLYLPATLEDAVRFKTEHPHALIVAGATDLGVLSNKGRIEPRVVLALGARIPGFADATIEDGTLEAGAGATWTQIAAIVSERLPELHRILELFGAPQIRNLGTVGGNIANASPIADSLPFLFVVGAELELLGPSGGRRVAIERFFRGYKETDLGAGELIARVRVPLPAPHATLRLYKASKRRDLDISSFAAAILLEHQHGRIGRARIAFGGVGPVVLRLPAAEAFLQGREWSEEVARAAGEIACSEITPISDVRGSAEYRYRLARNALLRCFFETQPEHAPLPSTTTV